MVPFTGHGVKRPSDMAEVLESVGKAKFGMRRYGDPSVPVNVPWTCARKKRGDLQPNFECVLIPMGWVLKRHRKVG